VSLPRRSTIAYPAYGEQPQRTTLQAETVPDRVVSLPRRSTIAYPAYGEQPRRTTVPKDTLLTRGR
jgi:hypothetical protein